MPTNEACKPSYDEWLHWTHVVVERLTTIVQTYNRPPYLDSSLKDDERQFKSSQTIHALRRLHTLRDEQEELNQAAEARVGALWEQAIADLSPLFQDILRRLPAYAADMQKLLKSPWYDNCNGKVARVLFRGPDNHESEGIGSGHVEHGRLPEVLQNLLEREQIGNARAPREAQSRSSAGSTTGTQSPTDRGDEVSRRWVRHNASFLRSAGRLD